MTTLKTHPYEQFKNDKSSALRFSKKTPSEKAELATRMRNYPNKNHF